MPPSDIGEGNAIAQSPSYGILDHCDGGCGGGKKNIEKKLNIKFQNALDVCTEKSKL